MIIGTIPHEEAVIQHFMEDPELAQIMLQEAINDGDIDEVRKIQERINEAKSRQYWGALLGYAEKTAQEGKNLEAIIALMTRALGILKAAVPASA